MSLGALFLIVLAAIVGFILGELAGSKHLKMASFISGFLILLTFLLTSISL